MDCQLSKEQELQERSKEERAAFLKKVSTTMSNSELAWWLRDKQVSTAVLSGIRKRGASHRQELVKLVMAHYDNERKGP